MSVCQAELVYTAKKNAHLEDLEVPVPSFVIADMEFVTLLMEAVAVSRVGVEKTVQKDALKVLLFC